MDDFGLPSGGEAPPSVAGGPAAGAAAPSNTAPYNCNDGMHVLRVGVDTLVVSHHGQLSGEWPIRLQELKKLAQSEDRKERVRAQVQVGGQLLSLADKGSRQFAYVLSNNWYRISVSKGKAGRLPVLYTRIGSEVLTCEGLDLPLKALGAIADEMAELDEDRGAEVSEIHLCADFTAPLDLGALPEAAFVTRAHRVTKYWDHLICTGFTAGLGGYLAFRLYDKTEEIKASGKDYMREIWQRQGWDGESHVYRVEFQIRRPILKELQIVSLDGVLGHCDRLWAYCTQEWLRLCIPDDSDRTRSRWPVHPVWRRIQYAPWADDLGEPLRRVRTDTAPSEERVVNMARSWIVAFMVIRGIDDWDEALVALSEANYQQLVGLEAVRARLPEDEIALLVAERRRRYACGVNRPDPSAYDPVKVALAKRYRQGRDGE